MSNRIGMLLMFVILISAGCQMDQDVDSKKTSEIAESKLPDVHAFDDPFTLDFLQSIEETEEGFYPFLSQTGKYKMDFPAGGVIDEQSYSVKDNVFEEVHISIEDDTGFGMDVIYFSSNTKELLKDDLDAFKTRLGYDGDFEKLEKDDRTIYYAHYKNDVFRTFAGYILNEQGTGGIEVIYNIDCLDKEEQCRENKQSDKKLGMTWLESIQFIDEDEGEDDE